jgi:hypothetical protein
MEDTLPLGMQHFPSGAGIPKFRVGCIDCQISNFDLRDPIGDWRLEMDVVKRILRSGYHQIERTLTNFWRDDGQDFRPLVDQIAGLVKDMQNAWSL